MVNPEKPAPRKRRKPGAAATGPLASHTTASGVALSSDPTTPVAASEHSLDEARRQKIAAIKKAVDEGTYHVSNEEVARKVIEHMFQPKK